MFKLVVSFIDETLEDTGDLFFVQDLMEVHLHYPTQRNNKKKKNRQPKQKKSTTLESLNQSKTQNPWKHEEISIMRLYGPLCGLVLQID